MLEKIERLRKLQKESHQIMDDISESLHGKCRENLFDVLDSILENIDEFPDSESAMLMINELGSTISHRKDRNKKEKRAKKEKDPLNTDD